MTPEKPTDEKGPEGEVQAKPDAKPAAAKKPAAEKTAGAAKPAAAKKPAAKRSAAKKPVEAKGAEAESVAEAKPARARKAAAKKDDPAPEEPVAKKPAARKPAEQPGEKQDEKPTAERASAAEAREPAAVKPEKPTAAKPAAVAGRDAQAAASTSRRKMVRAQARYVRTSARKARMVCGHLRGKSVIEARAILAFTPREVARDWSKLLESAVANAENNHELVEDDLFVREAYADEGPTIKRFRPRAQGRATPIRKRTSHLTITLTPKS
jgi:ribosomal protein L22